VSGATGKPGLRGHRGSTSARGRAAERRVARHYRLRGYRILARNVRAGGVELDLIVRRGRRLVFCEVKLKAGPRFGDPLEAVDEWKRERLRLGAEAWLLANPSLAGLHVTFEFAAVRPSGIERVSDLVY
jgi:Holliday junction resolvase-like predicted endonuclease